MIQIMPTIRAAAVADGKVPLELQDVFEKTFRYGNALGEKLPAGLLKDVKGTIPGVAAPGDLRQRLLKVDPALKDFSYSSESYDAVVVVALAAELAKSDAGVDIAKQLMAVTSGGTKCTTIKACFDLAKAGTDFDYDGVSGPIEFNENGDPTEASVGVYTYGPDNKLVWKVATAGRPFGVKRY